MSTSESEAPPPQRRWLAAAASFFGFVYGLGVGHFVRGHILRGWLWFAGGLAILPAALYFPVAALAASLVIVLGCMVDSVIAPPRPLPSWGKVGLWFGALLLAGFALRFGLRVFVVESFKLPSASMRPTLLVGDHFFVNKLARDPRRGDIVVFVSPSDPKKEYVKRVIALAGDRLSIQKDEISINGKRLARKKLDEPCPKCSLYEERSSDGKARYRIIYDSPRSPSMPDIAATTVPKGHVYLVGDNRDNSHDSRSFGPVSLDKVKGTVCAVFLSYLEGKDELRIERMGLSLDPRKPRTTK
jgi:signal peptidase I